MPHARRHPRSRLCVVLVSDANISVSECTGWGVDSVPRVDLSSVFLAQCVQRLIRLDSMFAQPFGQLLKSSPAAVIVVEHIWLGLAGRFNHKLALCAGSVAAKDFHELRINRNITN